MDPKDKSAKTRTYWEESARQHGLDVKATTRTPTAKRLEIAALTRVLASIKKDCGPLSILEAGCGNGQNCVALAKAFPDDTFLGFDYIPEMVTAAIVMRDDSGISANAVSFTQADVTDLSKFSSQFDVVLSVRCLINLSTIDEQLKALTGLAGLVKDRGHLLLIENSDRTYGNQNNLRIAGGLDPRSPANFNLFLNDEKTVSHIKALGFDVDARDFSSLHDLILYVLLPMSNGGSIDYQHPIVEAATSLSLHLGEKSENFGAIGQNRLFVCRKS